MRNFVTTCIDKVFLTTAEGSRNYELIEVALNKKHKG